MSSPAQYRGLFGGLYPLGDAVEVEPKSADSPCRNVPARPLGVNPPSAGNNAPIDRNAQETGMTVPMRLTSAVATGAATLMAITALTGGGTQASASPTSQPHRTEAPTPAPALSIGHTRFEIRNETGATIDLYAYQHGKVGMPLHKIATLGDKGLWHNTASNSASDASKDHNIVVFSRGRPVMRVTAGNPPIGYPDLVAHYAKRGSKNGKVGGGLSVDEAHTHKDTAFEAHFSRGCDIDSGAWYRANTKRLSLSLRTVPSTEYSTADDQSEGGNAPA